MENELGRFESDTAHRLTKSQLGTERVPSLLVLQGPMTGRHIALPSQATVGRSVDADVVLDDRLVSRRHAEIAAVYPKGSYEIADLGSRYGTYLNGRRVLRAMLSDGDKILIGSTVLRFALENPTESKSGGGFERKYSRAISRAWFALRQRPGHSAGVGAPARHRGSRS